ncbi:Wat1-related protein [Thalictrum thalictroides]|uniref:WAT1-related protein n=1 Tax=Thalictrum thalictroides TaxID=46969 RepID=A0A7J6WCJ7_THATH|nr:Wat1-related protein [Thalictrum thalictroides]
MIMALYKGPILKMFSEKSSAHIETTTTNVGTGHNFLVGALILICSCVIWSGFFILQSITLKEYPAALSLTSLIVFLGMVQGAAVALVMEHDFKAWAIGFDSRLLAPVYSGIVGSAMAYYLQGVVMKEKGPVFVTAFNPLCMIVVAALGSLVLAEQLHLGSVIGSIAIVIGLYSVIWGKSQDHTGTGSSPIVAKDAIDHENNHSGAIKPSELIEVEAFG